MMANPSAAAGPNSGVSMASSAAAIPNGDRARNILFFGSIKFRKYIPYDIRLRLSMIFGVTIGGPIGKGAFGQVYEGTWNGVKVAIKSIPDENVSILLSEAAVLTYVIYTTNNPPSPSLFRPSLSPLYYSTLRHPNIVAFIGLYAAEKHHYMVTEFVEGGSLEFLLHWQPGFFSYRDVVRLARDAAAGMLLLEHKGIIHRDLVARNLLVLSFLSPLVFTASPSFLLLLKFT